MKFIFLACWLASPAVLLARQKAPSQYTIPIPPPPDFSAFSWLLGQWTGQTAPKSPAGNLKFSAEYDVGKRVMVLREKISLASTKAAPATDESWMGILAPGRSSSSFDLQIYSSAGFISRCLVSANGDTIHIEPAGGPAPPPGMLFRRTIQREQDGGFTETVQVAPPAESFFTYYTARFSKVAPAKAPVAPPPAKPLVKSPASPLAEPPAKP